MRIPKILHQTWKDENIPKHLKGYVQSWKEHHPDWEYRLWTDEMNRKFIAENAPHFLHIYDNYTYAIQRVDAVRYFILLQYGGVFIDLDFECLKNISPIVDRADVVAGLEPQSHAVLHHKDYIISNAFLAAKPGSSFIGEICSRLIANDFEKYRKEIGFNYILDCAGPFMLSRIYKDYNGNDTVEILSSEVLYPLEKDAQSGRIKALTDYNTDILANAYAIHHYWGSWWQESESL